MKQLLLYFLLFFSTCAVAQSFTHNFVGEAEYGIATSPLNQENPIISIFPNPTADFITIDDNENAVSSATIFNLLGKKVITFTVNGPTTYDLMALQKGIYLVQLKDGQDNILQTVRVKKI